MGIEIKDGNYNYVEDEIVEVVPIETEPISISEKVEIFQDKIVELATELETIKEEINNAWWCAWKMAHASTRWNRG